MDNHSRIEQRNHCYDAIVSRLARAESMDVDRWTLDAHPLHVAQLFRVLQGRGEVQTDASTGYLSLRWISDTTLAALQSEIMRSALYKLHTIGAGNSRAVKIYKDWEWFTGGRVNDRQQHRLVLVGWPEYN